MPELRKDPIVGRWVIIATDRARRPYAVTHEVEPAGRVWPFCPGAAGTTPPHSDSQLIALPTVPKNVVDELAGSLDYFRFKERCVFCDIVDQELADRRRVVCESAQFLVAEPYAPKFPFETWIVP